MKEEKFKIIQFIREFIIRVDKELNNFPKKDIEIKNKIRNDAQSLASDTSFPQSQRVADGRLRACQPFWYDYCADRRAVLNGRDTAVYRWRQFYEARADCRREACECRPNSVGQGSGVQV